MQLLQPDTLTLLPRLLTLAGTVLVATLSARNQDTGTFLWKRYVLKALALPGTALEKFIRSTHAPWPGGPGGLPPSGPPHRFAGPRRFPISDREKEIPWTC